MERTVTDTQLTFITSGDIARALGVDVQRVRHVLNTRREIQPVGRAGLVRLYGKDAIDHVRSELTNQPT